MKRLIISMSLIAIVILSAYNRQIKQTLFPEKPVQKEISFTVGTDRNYSSAVYKNAMATLHVTIKKIRGNKELVVWEKTYDTLQLKQYPRLENGLTQQVNIPDIFDKSEELIVTYTITYDDNGNILRLANGTMVSNGTKQSKLLINI